MEKIKADATAKKEREKAAFFAKKEGRASALDRPVFLLLNDFDHNDRTDQEYYGRKERVKSQSPKRGEVATHRIDDQDSVSISEQEKAADTEQVRWVVGDKVEALNKPNSPEEAWLPGKITRVRSNS